MFMKNPCLRSVEDVIEITEEQKIELAKCYKDVFEFAKYFYIIDAGKGFVPIVLREYQKRVLQALVADTGDRKYRIIMQGRQTGKTTIVSLYLLWRFIFEKDKTIAILANKEDQALEIMKRMKNAFLKLPLWMQPSVTKWTESEKILDNGNTLMSAASSSDSIRGRSINYMLVDEFAHLDNALALDFMDSVFPCISADPNGQLILISTPNGTNQFYEIWQRARSGTNSFIPIFVAWDEIPGRDEAFRKKIIRDRGIRHFQQEYACISSDARIRIYDTVEKRDFYIKIGDFYKMLV